MLLFPRCAAAVLSILIAGGANAASRQLGPHVHGQASLDAATEGVELDVTLSLPGHDAVGFEHPPASPAERNALARAVATLSDPAWLLPARAAGCALIAHTIDANGFAGAAGPGGHADIDAHYRYRCTHIDRLDQLDVRLIGAFPSLTRVVVDTITAQGGAQLTLEGRDTRVPLAP